MYDLLWDKRMLGVFKDFACLTEEENIVLEDWINGENIDNTAMTYHMSYRKVNRIRHKIREKYDRVQPFAGLPQRKKKA